MCNMFLRTSDRIFLFKVGRAVAHFFAYFSLSSITIFFAQEEAEMSQFPGGRHIDTNTNKECIEYCANTQERCIIIIAFHIEQQQLE